MIRSHIKEWVGNLGKLELTEDRIEKIKSVCYLREVDPNLIYIFPIMLCHNDIDVDYEAFTDKALEQLSDLYVGRHGFVDDFNFNNARIFDTKIIQPNKNHFFKYVLAEVVLFKNEHTERVINYIENTPFIEISIACSVKDRRCSICGKQIYECKHLKGSYYDGKLSDDVLCFAELNDVTDVYEWAFVAPCDNDIEES